MTAVAGLATMSFLLIRKPHETLELKFERRMSKIDSILSNRSSKLGEHDRASIKSMLSEHEEEEKKTTIKEDI
jgi:hypothetical protein